MTRCFHLDLCSYLSRWVFSFDCAAAQLFFTQEVRLGQKVWTDPWFCPSTRLAIKGLSLRSQLQEVLQETPDVGGKLASFL